MALVVYWYDSVCFGIVAAAIFGSFWVILKKQVSGWRWGEPDGSFYRSLIAVDPSLESLRFAYLWRSCWRGLHPAVLLAFRLSSFLIMAGLLTWDVSTWGSSIFVYYTEWTFALVILYFALGTILSAYGWLTSCSGLYSSSYPFKETGWKDVVDMENTVDGEVAHPRPGFIEHFMQAIYQASAGAVILTDVVFWCVIVPFTSNSHLRLNLLMGCMHSVNALLLLLDTYFNSLPFSWHGMSYFVMWSCLYVIFQWTSHACCVNWWPYPFLILSDPWAPLWYFCMAIIHLPCYGVYALAVRSKTYCLSKLFHHVSLS